MKKKFSLINICLYLYIVLKPFYLLSSGNLQISDGLILIAFILTIFNKKEFNNTEIKMLKDFKILLIFLFFVISINVIGFAMYMTKDYIMSTLYYGFITLGIYVFIFKITDTYFLKNVYNLCAFNILVQLIIFILGMGKYYSSIRYMGTFNDPNQFGFFIVLMAMLMSIIKNYLSKKNNNFYFFFSISCFLIFQAASTGMLLAIGTYLVLNILCRIPESYMKIKIYLPKIIITFTFFILLCLIVFLEYATNEKIKLQVKDFTENKIIESSIAQRITQKFSKAQKDEDGLLEDRHLEQIVEYPQYLIFRSRTGKLW